MTRRERTEVLVEGDPALRRSLAATVRERYRTAPVEPPAPGLVMLRLRETAKRSLFFVGELLVTEARVEVEGRIGIGIVAGDRPEAAEELALIDGAFRAGVPEVAAWEALLAEEAGLLADRRSQEEARILATRVRFETMETGS